MTDYQLEKATTLGRVRITAAVSANPRYDDAEAFALIKRLEQPRRRALLAQKLGNQRRSRIVIRKVLGIDVGTITVLAVDGRHSPTRSTEEQEMILVRGTIVDDYPAGSNGEYAEVVA